LYQLFRWRQPRLREADNSAANEQGDNMLKAAIGLTAALFLYAASAGAQTPDMKSLVAGLKEGGYVIVFRHGATNRDQADTDPLNPRNVAKQRLLSVEGREVAQQVGAAYRKLGIPLGDVYTSVFDRAVETGKLVSGHDVVATLDITEGGLVVTPIENDRRAAALKKMAATNPAAGKNTLIVTHKPNILDAFGKNWFEVREGEASVFRPDGSGKPVPVGRVQAAGWIKAAGD
jgi:phosphohistidine phosphatase SixA